MMRSLKRGTLPVVMLVVVVAWALFAVTMLTGTLVAAQQIDNRVGVINDQVNPIDEDLDAVVLAVETGRIAVEINKAAKPLGGQFAQIVQTGDGIEASAVSIAERAKQINGNAEAINSTVTTINSNVGEIGSSVSTIGSNIASINANAESINSSVDEIGGSFVGIVGETASIDDQVAGINGRADTVIGISRGIKENTGQIIPLVVDINANAAAIAGSPLLLRNLLNVNQLAAAGALGAPVPAAPGTPLPELLPLPDVPEILPLPVPDVAPELLSEPLVELPLADAGLLQSSGSDSGNLLGALR